jgi:two-component system chemotaxis response regulator CheY
MMPKRILIVDDSAIARSIIKRSLEICGFDETEVLEAGDGNEALATLKNEDVDIVFTDLNMPDMSGEQLLKRIKSSPKLFEIPVIIITSMKNPAKEKKLISEHAAAVLAKPLKLPLLRQILEEKLQVL